MIFKIATKNKHTNSRTVFTLASEPTGVRRVSRGNVFVHRMSDGSITASLDVDVIEREKTSREALEALATTLQRITDEVTELVKNCRRG